MTKEEYVKENLLKQTQYWIEAILILGGILFLLLALMDYHAANPYFPYFLKLRIAIAAVLGFLALLNRRRSERLQYSIIIVGSALSALTIELMILKLGGHRSSYYAGLNLVVICVLGFVPINVKTSALVVSTIYLIYLIPILLFDRITDISTFASNNAFLISTFLILLVWRSLSQKRLQKELELQYELNREREKLAHYSSELERIVDERTKRLQRSEQVLRTLFENANDGIVIMDREGNIIRDNPRAREIHGYETLVGRNVRTLEVDKDLTKWRERMERLLAGESLVFETEHYRKDGTKVSLEVSSRAIEIEGEKYIQSFYRDITERKRLQAQLLHSQKMESIGILAGGIAHDFNNLLTSIRGYADLLLMDEGLDEKVAEKVKQIEISARSASQLVSKLLNFARRKEMEIVPFDLNRVVEDTLTMVSRMIPKNVAVKKELSEPLTSIEGDVSQIEQVLLNLILNAVDAMPEGGEITIRTQEISLPDRRRYLVHLPPGRYVHLSVADTGVGIPQEHLPHIFEPFYTTKERGKGTGLGLAMVYGIVKEHKGEITVESKVGEGTVFDIYLPVSEKKAISMSEEGEVRVPPPVEGRRILVIDDEVAVLKLIKEILERSGYEVVATADPLQGVETLERERHGIDLLITDMIMPKMDGGKVAKRAKEINPQIKVIAITGYRDEIEDVPVDGFLRKPFETGKLLSMVRDVLWGHREMTT